MLSVAMLKYSNQKQPGMERVYLACTSRSQSIIGREPGQELRQELKQKPWHSAVYWLALWFMLNKLLSTAQAHLPRDGAAHRGFGLPTSIISQGNLLQTSQTSLIWKIPQWRCPLLQVTLGCVKKMTIKANQDKRQRISELDAVDSMWRRTLETSAACDKAGLRKSPG